MKFLKKQKLAERISILATLITAAGMFFLWIIVAQNAAFSAKANITTQMADGVKVRAAVIDDYVTSAEEYMIAFSLGEEVRNLLHDPENPELIQQAQKYTEDFAAVKGVFEGLYIATPETHVRTHNVKAVVGKITRPGDMLAPFQKTILAKQELTNLGIMKSPGTGAMIISMYYPIFEEKKCIGYIGAAVFASNLMDSLTELTIEGLPNSEYVFLDAETGLYLYHPDEALINTETTDPGYQEIMQRIQTDRSTEPGSYTYRDENGKKQIAVYQYLKDRGWIFIIRNSTKEAFGVLVGITIIIGVICAVIAGVISVIMRLVMRSVGRDLMTVETSIEQLGRLELDADKNLESLYEKEDEIGMIARTTHALCDRLRLTIEDISRVLGEMADGNIAVDVSQGEANYIGDFKVLAGSLKTIRENLLKLTRNIIQVSGRVTDEAEQVSQNTESLSQGILTQESAVNRLTESMDAITAQIKSSANNCTEAQKLADQAAMYTVEADQKVVGLTDAMDHITSSSAEIEKIIRVIEDIAFQTNILALNAAIEAARAGAAGQGFAVVAGEVRAMAAKSIEAAKNTAELINRSVEAVHTGREATAQAADIMRTIGECTDSIKKQMDGIAAASTQQSDMISGVGKEIKEISRVVQTNSASVNHSVSTLQELAAQAEELNTLIGRFQTGN